VPKLIRTINQDGLALLKSFEKCSLTAYQDQGGVWTIGWGHTGTVAQKGATCKQDFADALLEKDLEEKAYPAYNNIWISVSDNQISAIYVLVFNIGLHAFIQSETLKCINKKEDPTAEWMGFCYVDGKISDGLIARRKAELELFKRG
jgi:lysozyme